MDKTELVVIALQQRIGEIVSNYETQIAMLRAEITHLSEQLEAKNKLEDYSKNMEEKTSIENIDQC